MKDEERVERETGTVVNFDARRGFGFIQPLGEEDKSKQVFCHWKQLQTDDRWPQLTEKMHVEYTPKKDNIGKFKAENVTMVGGGKICLGEDSQKNYNMTTKYTGKVQFYDSRKGFGFIIPAGDEKIQWAGETVDMEKGLYVAREEIISDNQPPALNDGAEVEFHLYHHLTKGLGAGHVSAVGGGKIVFKPNNNQKRGRGWGRGSWNQAGIRRSRPVPFRGMDTDKIEIGLYIQNCYIGRLIGKGGETVKAIRDVSGGAQLQFSDVRKKSFANRQVVSIVGDENQVSAACIEIVTKVKEFDDGGKPTIVFLIPHSYCGMFIGKKGTNLNEIEDSSGAMIDVSKVPVQLTGGSLVSLAEVRGEVPQIGEACKKIVPVLGKIAKRVIQDNVGFNNRGRW